MATPHFETERLRLHLVDEADAPIMLAIYNDPAFMRNVGDRGIRTEADALKFIRERLLPMHKRDGFGCFAVTLKESEAAIGICTLLKRDYLEHADIGFAFLPDYCGKGFAYESSRALLHYARDTLRFKEICGITVAENTPSIRLLEKLGLRYEKKVQAPGDAKTTSLYSLTF